MGKKLKIIFLFLVCFLFLPDFVSPVNAGFLKFDNTTATAANGATFQLSVIVDPGSDSINSADIYVTYDSTLLKATTVTAGSLFSTVSNDIATSGIVYIAGMVDDPASSISSSGTVATITFQALKDGTGTLTFDCNTSKIIKNDINASNVIACSSNGTSVVTIGSGSSGSSVTPTTAPISELPQSGVFDNVTNIAIPGMILLIFGGIFRLLL